MQPPASPVRNPARSKQICRNAPAFKAQLTSRHKTAMHSFMLQRTQFRQCTCSGRDKAAAAAAAAAAAPTTSAAVTRQQHAARVCQQTRSRSQVVARVRIEDLEQARAPTPAAEALQAYMQLEQAGELNSVTASNIRWALSTHLQCSRPVHVVSNRG